MDRELTERRARGEVHRPLDEAIALLAPAARALDVAHRQRVAHRDVKPANLFLTEIADLRTLKVLDFGIDKVMSTLASTTEALAATAGSLRAFSPQYDRERADTVGRSRRARRIAGCPRMIERRYTTSNIYGSCWG